LFSWLPEFLAWFSGFSLVEADIFEHSYVRSSGFAFIGVHSRLLMLQVSGAVVSAAAGYAVEERINYRVARELIDVPRDLLHAARRAAATGRNPSCAAKGTPIARSAEGRCDHPIAAVSGGGRVPSMAASYILAPRENVAGYGNPA